MTTVVQGGITLAALISRRFPTITGRLPLEAGLYSGNLKRNFTVVEEGIRKSRAGSKVNEDA